MLQLSWQEPVPCNWNLEGHHLLNSGEAVAVIGRYLSDAKLCAHPNELLADPPSSLLLTQSQIKMPAPPGCKFIFLRGDFIIKMEQ
jgi:hypothetical protein